MAYTKEEMDEIERIVTELDDEDREAELFNPTFKPTEEEEEEEESNDDAAVVNVDSVDDTTLTDDTTASYDPDVDVDVDTTSIVDTPTEDVDTSDNIVTADETSTPESDPYITIGEGDTRKLKLKYNGEDVEIPASDIVKFSQIGIDAQNKNYKEAVQTAKVMQNLGISTTDLENLAKLKSGDSSALKNIMANSNLKLEDVRTDIFEYEQDDLDTIRSTQQPSGASEISSIIQNSPQRVHEVYNRLENVFPGMAQYQKRLVSQNDVANYERFLYNLETGAFEQVSTKAAIKFASLTDLERNRITSDTGYFNGFVNKLFNDGVQDQAQPEVNSNSVDTQISNATPAQVRGNQTQSVTVDKSKKDSYGKPKGTPPIVDNKRNTKEKTAEQLTQEYMEMDDSKFSSMVRARR